MAEPVSQSQSAVPAPTLVPYGDAAILITYQINGYSDAVMDHVHILADHLRRIGDWDNIVPGYDSLLVSFNPSRITLENATRRIETTIKTAQANPADVLAVGSRVDIPVCYGGAYGPDMDTIQQASGLKIDDIIALHSAQDYRVCMMGFIPGFAFLSQAPKALRYPRRATPRLNVAAGSIGIAGWQTGIYGMSSPGGWQIIGRTPLALFDANRAEPFALKAGDRVRFIPSSTDIFGADDGERSAP